MSNAWKSPEDLAKLNWRDKQKKFKSWREGFRSARAGDGKETCPYEITDEIRKLLIRRYRWMDGWEEASYRPSKKKRRQMERETKKKKKKHGK
jgi:ribosome modulation factor